MAQHIRAYLCNWQSLRLQLAEPTSAIGSGILLVSTGPFS